MVNNINPIEGRPSQVPGIRPNRPVIPNDLRSTSGAAARLEVRGEVTTTETLDRARERAFAQLRGVVDEARAALNLPEGQAIDTSPEATGERIANFALRFFNDFAENNGLEDTPEGRQQFADFIGGAIGQGIEEAREILQGLEVLSPSVTQLIDDTAAVVDNILNDFVENGL